MTGAAVFAIYAALTLIGGAFRFTSHEADMIHLVELVLRVSAGAVPHLDFMTPIGHWAILPMALLHRAGVGLGYAMISSQVLVAAALFPVCAWLSLTRLTLRQSLALFLVVMGLCMAMVFGSADPLISLSMHYNRWCWAASILVVIAVLIPPRTPGTGYVDGIAVGALMAAMAMTKVTFAIALAAPVIFALLRGGRSPDLFVAFAAAFAMLLAVTLFHGAEFWWAYAADLLAVTGSENRPMPSAHWRALLLSPAGTPVTAAVLFGLWCLSKGGRRDLAAMLLLFYPAFVFITWQNFGNDPVWLLALALVLWVVSDGLTGPARLLSRGTALVATVLILPAAINMLYSPVRHLMLADDGFRPMLESHPDLRMATARGEGAWVKQTVIFPQKTEPTVFRGETLAECELSGGLVARLERDAAALVSLAPELDRQPLVADLFSPHWLFSDLRPLAGGAPWYYDGLPGLAEAAHVLVPACPADIRARRHVLRLLVEAGVILRAIGETPDFKLYRIERQEKAASAT
ncbi:hypothetical protein OB2597_15735 [Pseudooceanicola batsensis HTCC2597]|uniref:Glycosyltransferase RgtA/B/C/D-like domain-containing protein n=1 Tax=Pseudooceanicola batsensis (strain ATCC BAA-863 / DSM 15984 / KCTC 12145 / HTCC2597) TaxID=252305 RepID=A3TZ29_PSEBH|nr:hypothetical protein OB2597_15735 [Pseudooceanicola batsensis HTCC2597]